MDQVKKVLIVSAHPDDMEIGMGGTVARMVAAGVAVSSLILTDGRRSPNPFGFAEEQMVAVRRKDAQSAAAVLTLKELIFYDLPDLRSDENASLAVSRIQQTISRIQPVEIYTLHPELDRHPTHRAAGSLVLKSLEQVQTPPSVWAYEVWGLFPCWDRYEDISSTISIKLAAISEHKSQIATIPYADGVLGLNRWRGVFADPEQSKAQAAYAEVFLRLCPGA